MLLSEPKLNTQYLVMLEVELDLLQNRNAYVIMTFCVTILMWNVLLRVVNWIY